MTNQATQFSQWLRESQRAVAFTGAGISTESGIPDFRSPGGVWSKYQPVMYDDFMNHAASRHEYWRQKSEAHGDFADAAPNLGHQTLARWETDGILKAVITQNIDGLHQQAGSRKVFELHGTAREVECQDCQARYPVGPMVEEFKRTDQVPACPQCDDGRLKHATISFGQSLPEEILAAAQGLAQGCDLLLAMGSSLQVFPAAALPALAKNSGARVVIINRDPTEQDDLADLVIHAGIGETLAAANDLLVGDALSAENEQDDSETTSET
ncbi:MAG: Sir2 family NAD-dependent protein deacetylase [Planctomycetales bacterium]